MCRGRCFLGPQKHILTLNSLQTHFLNVSFPPSLTKPFGFYYSVYFLPRSALMVCKFENSTIHIFISDKHVEGARPRLDGELSPCCHRLPGPCPEDPHVLGHVQGHMAGSTLQVSITKAAATEAAHIGCPPDHPIRTQRSPGSGPKLTAYCILDAQAHLSTVYPEP